MNASRIRHAASEIERYQRALAWLSEHGVKITKDGDEEVNYRPNLAGSCAGSMEASGVLSAMMTNQLPALIPNAIKNCENTIEIHREIIRNEASS